jgi:ABC-2 type transport system ATP-binding protein
VLQEETETLRARGADVERQLGPTKSAMVYGRLDERDRRQARDAGLDLGPVALQDLFVHLTQPTGGPR